MLPDVWTNTSMNFKISTNDDLLPLNTSWGPLLFMQLSGGTLPPATILLTNINIIIIILALVDYIMCMEVAGSIGRQLANILTGLATIWIGERKTCMSPLKSKSPLVFVNKLRQYKRVHNSVKRQTDCTVAIILVTVSAYNWVYYRRYNLVSYASYAVENLKFKL